VTRDLKCAASGIEAAVSDIGRQQCDSTELPLMLCHDVKERGTKLEEWNGMKARKQVGAAIFAVGAANKVLPATGHWEGKRIIV
jgi:hypothetical protein